MSNRINARVKREIDLLNSGLSKGRILEDMIVLRKTIPKYMNIKSDNSPITIDDMVDIKDRIITNKNFTSTSLEKFPYQGRNAVIKLKVPKGYKGAMYIKKIAHKKFKFQEELLFKQGMQYIIKLVVYRDNFYYIEAEVINNG